MKIFKSIENAEKYLNDLASEKGLKNFHTWTGVDKKSNDVMILTSEDEDGSPDKDIETVTFIK